ncbi:UNVERIFIED_ORG: O-antigen/teichoic acid export membrane protein [Mycolicibacterium obuense]
MLAVTVSIAVAVANTFAVGAGDQLAALVSHNPRAAWNFVLRIGVVSISLALVCSVLGPALTSSTLAILANCLSICLSTAVCMTVMNYLRGRGSIVSGSLIAYVALPTLRLLAVLSLFLANSRTLLDTLAAIGIASLIAAIVAFAVASMAARAQSSMNAVRAAPKMHAAILIGTAIAACWMVLGQGDVTALAIYRGSAAAGEYTPTMRVLEALTAIGIGVKFADTRHMLANPHAGLRARIVVPLSGAYLVSALLCPLVAPPILELSFGSTYEFNYAVAGLLIPVYYLSILITILLQILIARGLGREVAVWTTGVIALALATLAAGAQMGGPVGVAVADLLIYGVWFAIMLYLEVRSRRGSCGDKQGVHE